MNLDTNLTVLNVKRNVEMAKSLELKFVMTGLMTETVVLLDAKGSIRSLIVVLLVI